MNSKQQWLHVACLLATLSCAAQGAGLGKLTVQSGLGQPFRGEIDLIAVPVEELSAVSARTASPDTYREANIEYQSSVANIKFTVEKRSSGQPYIKVFSAQPMEEPFVELLVEVAWPSGKLLREYPILLDPPGFTSARNLPETGVAPLPPTPRAATGNGTVAQPASAAATAAPAPAVTSAAVNAAPPKPAEAPNTALGKPDPVKPAAAASAEFYGPVKPGETLRSIADRTRPHDVGLDQMMVAIYRENVGSFIGKNLNQLKIGERLKMPAEGAAAKVPLGEARTLIRVQTARWIAYHQKLAAAAAKAPPKTAPAQQSAAGQVTPKVQDKTPAPSAGTDVLTISKGVGAQAGGKDKDKVKATKLSNKQLQDRISALEEEATAREGALKEANSRVAQLERQVQEMRELITMKRGDLARPGNEPAAPVSPAKPSESVASAPMPPKPADMTPQPVIAPPKPAVTPEQDVGMMQKIMDGVGSAISSLLSNPLLLGGIGAAVLGTFGLLYLRRKRAAQLGAFTASNMAPVAASATAAAAAASAPAVAAAADKKGGLVETGESAFLSEFNKVAPGAADSDDVDPVAEADVYLAYGRDAQAEEILKEAMPKDPQRVEIPLKLLEIYAGRKSVEAFESVANNVHAAIGEDHPAWARVCELGRSIDPGNALYGNERAEPSLGADSTLGRNNVISFPERKAEGAQEPELKEEGLDFDLGFGDAAPAVTPKSEATGVSKDAVDFDFSEMADATPAKPDLGLDGPQAEKFDLEFDVGSKEQAKVELPLAASANDGLAADFDIDFDLDSGAPGGAATATRSEQTSRLSDLDLELPVAAATAAPALDLKGINLDLNAPASDRAAASTETAIGDAPAWRTAATKLDLARAYLELGDKEGAKEIIDEVIKEGTPAQQQEAQKLAARL